VEKIGKTISKLNPKVASGVNVVKISFLPTEAVDLNKLVCLSYATESFNLAEHPIVLALQQFD
jgi:hypothetical protein